MYNTTQLVLEWEQIPVTIKGDPHLTEYNLVGVQTSMDVSNYKGVDDNSMMNYQSKFGKVQKNNYLKYLFM